jgi:hypothetical protein
MPPDTTDNYDLQLRNSVRDLRQLKQRLSFDVVVVWSERDGQDGRNIHPRQIGADLARHELSCWFSEAPEAVSMEQMAVILRSAGLVLFCVSDNFAGDKRCIQVCAYVTVNPQNQGINKVRVCEVKYCIEYFIKLQHNIYILNQLVEINKRV